MTSQRAGELNAESLERLRHSVEQCNYDEVYIDLGRDYLPALQGCAEVFSGRHVSYATGRIGERLQALRNWLKVKYEE
jgi:hypothetical protein